MNVRSTLIGEGMVERIYFHRFTGHGATRDFEIDASLDGDPLTIKVEDVGEDEIGLRIYSPDLTDEAHSALLGRVVGVRNAWEGYISAMSEGVDVNLLAKFR